MRDKFGKLQTLRVSGYKSIKAVNLKLGDINIVVGQNGAGKSNFVSLFRFLSNLAQENLRNYVAKQGGLTKILYFGPQVTRQLEIYFESDVNSYMARLEPTADGTLLVAEEQCAFKGTRRSIQVSQQIETELRRTTRAGRIPPYIYGPIENWRVYHFHDTSENAPLRSSASLIEADQLASDGGNLAAFLEQKDADLFGRLTDILRQIAPFFSIFVLRPEPLNEDLIRLRWRHRDHEQLFDVSDLSDGTLRFIALSALLLQPDPPSTIVLDEPELGLHPAAIATLAALMQQVAPRVQIIAATQSPTFLSHFGWEHLIVVDRKDDASEFRRLSEEEVRPWMDDFSMGEIWEKNIIGGRP